MSPREPHRVDPRRPRRPRTGAHRPSRRGGCLLTAFMAPVLLPAALIRRARADRGGAPAEIGWLLGAIAILVVLALVGARLTDWIVTEIRTWP